MNDLSFIRLEPSLSSAKYTRASSVADIFFFGQISLSPDEVYLQTTNLKDGIAFDGNYQVFVVDCDDRELLEITDRVAISEFTSFGIPQISFEIATIGVDFYAKPVYLKFVHTVSDYKWYSNPINITNYNFKQTSRFDYKNAKDEFYQSIRLKTWFNVNDAESNSDEYTTFDGKKVTSRLITTELEQYIFEKLDNFTYRRLNNLLARNILYLNGNRVTNKQVLSSKDRTGDTNVFNLDFKVAIDYNETFNYSYQIFDNLEILSYEPFDVISIEPNEIKVTYNYNLSLGTNPIVKLYKGASLIGTFTNPIITDNYFTIDVTGLCSDLETYRVEIYPNTIDGVVSQNEYFEWTFIYSGGEYDNTQYNNEYLIN
jgi:hypothetical protein